MLLPPALNSCKTLKNNYREVNVPANPPVLGMKYPWDKGTKNSEAKAVTEEYWRAQRERRRKNNENLFNEWIRNYMFFVESKGGKWCRSQKTTT